MRVCYLGPMRATALAVTMLAAACGMTEETYPDAVATEYCAAAKACDETSYFRTYREGTVQCEAEWSDEVESKKYGFGVAACTFQPDATDGCFDAIADASCTQLEHESGWLYDCWAAWDCVTILKAAP